MPEERFMTNGSRCPWCGKYNAEGTETCWSCKELMRRDPETVAARSKKLAREIAIFLIGYGIILVILGVLAWALIERRVGEGLPLGLLLGLPLIAIGTAGLSCGILLARTSRILFAILGSLVITIPSLAGLLFLGWAPVVTTIRGGSPSVPWLGFALLIAIPTSLGYRTYQLSGLTRS